LVSGVYEFILSSSSAGGAFRLHAGIRWGAILAILGAVHGIHDRLGKGRG
jgi:hypothetical protein